ncbi:hypothetical protein CHRY9390_03162 [Chryseobacterium aquaeductus]|uniref:Uncharacterized protein n=1 Tax=Chryseobacterium aquaeductus TaxID=2675056 RepID=A0A9N8MIH9_9FLAO|nr:hypothetical protein [Chryseobacterium aquaeductus]CAA7332439.1 hypothetical protein CHRY9390_03162 [Chryseobacterium potabilaquae]CAD7816404.1 hypothetical protein CHRY9390_03162 [Chryseobacterium aquaeductus]
MQSTIFHIESSLETVKINNEVFFKISDAESLRPFFMTIVSDSNHWMFVSSNGGLSAGRKNSEFALFPYYTDDKITESAEITGSKTILQVRRNEKTIVWEPFSVRNEAQFHTSRNVYKNEFGNKLIFEEINHDLELAFSYEWNNSREFGFIKKSKIKNLSSENKIITVLDGLQNILPYGIGSDLQNRVSNLGDAYKRTELDPKSGLGIFALSAIIVDKAEPSEALKANTVFSIGTENPTYLLSSLQLKNFRKGEKITQENDIKGEKGAYFIQQELEIDTEKEWWFVANVNQSQSAVIGWIERIKTEKNLPENIQKDIDLGTENLKKLVASADGLQFTNDDLRDSRHFSNTLFNIMRGGIFDDNYIIEKWDFYKYLEKANHEVFQNSKAIINQLSDKFSLFELNDALKNTQNADFIRLAKEYLPLKFSRRHGDPSRPWNKFSINTTSEVDGSKILDYEGNWRDIFQNWEALVHSYPYFIEGMIFKFLNATTFDGYNPYRITKDGFDWETIEADDPWSYIGYWGDHQIIYLLKFLEFAENYFPNSLETLLDKEYFVYANVPYKIKSYTEILKNPKDTIDFDFDLDEKIHERRKEIGADGALLCDENGDVMKVNFTEKILATVLAKLSNFILEGGIWMNTQRPEWNDANNALVGNGVSMVTLYYLRRMMKLFQAIFENSALENVQISSEFVDFYKKIREEFQENLHLLEGNISNEDRKKILDVFSEAASEYRNHIYTKGFLGKKRTISLEGLRRFTNLSLQFLEHSIKTNERKDGLYHAYNLMTSNEKSVAVSYLGEMLEGQVAVLSSQFLSSNEALKVLDALKNSALFREDQYSYLLYPNKQLKGFLERNSISENLVQQSALLQQLVSEKNTQIIEKDVLGNYHFNGNFKNAGDLEAGLNLLNVENQEKSLILEIFEEVFNHKEFTGRSGTFYGYEGLGSIYWHMVSKLLLAVMEVCQKAINENASPETVGRLLEHFYEINEGIGVHKSPELYGAFPTDAYSHTPFGKGAQQPGMTGQVKEDLLSRFGELGIVVKDGQLQFKPDLLRKEEFLTEEKTIKYFDVRSNTSSVKLLENSLFFTKCEVPVIYEISENESVEIFDEKCEPTSYNELIINKRDSENIFKRNGKISMIKVKIRKEQLK